MIHFSSQLTRAFFLWGCGFFPKTFFNQLQQITTSNNNNSNFLNSEKERGRRETREDRALLYIAKEICGYLERQFYELMRKYTRFFLCLCSIQSKCSYISAAVVPPYPKLNQNPKDVILLWRDDNAAFFLFFFDRCALVLHFLRAMMMCST